MKRIAGRNAQFNVKVVSIKIFPDSKRVCIGTGIKLTEVTIRKSIKIENTKVIIGLANS